MNAGETSSRGHGVGRPRVIKEKWRRRLFRLMKQNRWHTVEQPTAEDNVGHNRLFSEYAVQRPLLEMRLHSRYPNHVPLLTRRHRQLRLHLVKKHCGWLFINGRELPGLLNRESSFITSIVMYGEQGGNHIGVVVISCFGRRSHGPLS